MRTCACSSRPSPVSSGWGRWIPRALVAAHVEHRPVVPHIAVDALVSLGASTRRWPRSGKASAAVVTGALRVFQELHDAPTVSGLVYALAATRNVKYVRAILQSLSRLYHRDGVWRGTLPEWWSTRPDTTGPYYDPVAWEQSTRILSVLRAGSSDHSVIDRCAGREADAGSRAQSRASSRGKRRNWRTENGA